MINKNTNKNELITISRDDFNKAVMKTMDDILNDSDTEESKGKLMFALSVPAIANLIESNLFDSNNEPESNVR